MKKKSIKICDLCGRPEDKKWVDISPGRARLFYFCCLKAADEYSSNKGPALHKYKEAAAFGFDKKTGQPLAIDAKGNRFDPHLTRYADYPNDYHGWKATGKIKPKKTYHI